MMSHTWPIVVRGGMLSPRGYDPLYALMIVSHRVLRYLSPFLHLIALGTSIALLGQGWVYVAARRAPGRGARGARSRRCVPARPLLIARYYVLTTASLAAGLVGLAGARHPGRLGAGRGDAVMMRQAHARRRARARSGSRRHRAGASPLLARRDPARVARPPDLPPDPGRQGRPLRSRSTSCGRWSAAPSSPARDSRSRRATTGSRGSATFLRRYSLDELPNLWNVLRGEMSIVGPRPTLPVQVEQYTERQRGRLTVKPGITGWAQINGRASLPWSERIELDLWYVEHRSLALDLRILARTVEHGVQRSGPLQGRDGRMAADRARSRPAHRRRQALRHRLGVRPARDRGRGRSQPARAGAVRRRTTAAPVPRIDDPEYVPALQELCERYGVGAVVPLTDLDIEVLAPCPGGRASCRRSSPTRRSRARRSTSTRPTCCSSGWACPRRRRCCPGEPVDELPGDGQAAPGLGRALDPSRRRRGGRRSSSSTTSTSRRWSSGCMDGPEFSIDCLSDLDGRCLNAIPRTMIESRGGESIKGTVIADRGADRARPRGWSRRSASAGRARSRCSATARSGSGSPTSTRASAARSRRRCTRRCPAAPTRS